MGEIVAGAFAEFALSECFKAAKKGISLITGVNSACKKLKGTLDGLKLVVDEICVSGLELSPDWQSNVKVFREKHADGLRLVEECEKTSNLKLLKKFRYGRKIRNLQKYLGDFINTSISPQVTLNIMELPNISTRLKKLSEDVNNIGAKIEKNTRLENPRSNVEQHELRQRHCVPNMPSFFVGFDRSVEELKELVLATNVSAVGITGLSGMGKSTLATALCYHHQIKGHFERVIYITVSKNPNIMDMLENMWEDIVGGPKPGFGNLEDARNQLQCQINRRNQRTLVVLDDVCSRSNLQKLLFQGEHYKTLVTTRDENIIRKQSNVRLFPLQSLQEEHALQLFCYYAFDQLTIPATHDEKLVKQVEAKCDGLPLALQVIGSSLKDEPTPAWKIAKNKLSRGKTISTYHKEELHERLKTTSIDVLEEDVKQCFLDLAVIPQGQTFSVDVLLDIWVYVRGMEWEEAFMVLCELSARSLLELKRDPWGAGITQDCAYELSFSQHNVLRDLALYLVEQDNLSPCSRLCMPEKSDCIPPNWQTVQPCKAQIVSVHTGTMDEKQWGQMKFPEAEALVLYFTASRYCIPTFLHTMKKLKVLIVHNYGTRRATLNGLDVFNALSQLKTLKLEKLIVSPLYDYFNFLESLEKLSLSLCEGLNNMNELGGDEFFNFPRLSEIYVGHCSDLEELPKGIFSSNSIKNISVTNCHRLAKLPDELGNLGMLEVLRLCACAELTELPPSIRSLQKLEFLDISQCGRLKRFPDGFHELTSLRTLDMRECCELKQFCKPLGKLPSLKHVICDKKNEQQLEREANSTSNFTVEAVEEAFSLGWLGY